jgi:hypothetical protein
MRPLALSITAAFLLMVLSTDGFAKPPRKVVRSSPAIPLTECETITQPGNYILENDLILPLVYSGGEGGSGNCLVINSPRVNVDLNGHTITTACVLPSGSPFCPFFQGGIGIDIEADHVSIANGSVGEANGGFVYGLVGEADGISATNLDITTDIGIVLNDVSYSAFADIVYEGADLQEHAENGPVLSVTGGGNNIFASINSKSSTLDGIIITNSSNNIIEEANISCTAQEEAGPGILLTQESNHNFIAENNIFVLFGNGIEVDSGSAHNVILNNTVEIETTPPGFFAMLDQNPNCGSDLWIHNGFANLFAAGQISASPASCIH